MLSIYGGNSIFRTSSIVLRRFLTVPATSQRVPDVATFLKIIGRKCSEHEQVYDSSWDNLFKWDGPMLKQKGIPIQQRKYILSQVQKYRLQGPDSIKEIPKGKKSFFGGERKRKESKARWVAIARAEWRSQQQQS